jgi:tetratricopeptide (TPR) repeat protein
MDKEIYQNAQFTKVQSNNKDFARLVSTAHQISDLTPHSGKPFSTRAENFLTLEKILTAIDDFPATINLKSPLATEALVLAHFFRGNIHSNLQNWQNSILSYNAAISLDPNITNAHFNKANSQMQ